MHESGILTLMQYTDLLPLTNLKDGTEVDVLCFALDRARAQFAWKTEGLDAEQLRRQFPPSTMSLAGLIKHMAAVEDGFTSTAAGRAPGRPWDTAEAEGDKRWDWHSAATDEPEALYALWYGAVERSRTSWREMIADGGLDEPVAGGSDDWIMNRRRILVDLLEEYLKHTGHADLFREATDGLVGNDPPW